MFISDEGMCMRNTFLGARKIESVAVGMRTSVVNGLFFSVSLLPTSQNSALILRIFRQLSGDMYCKIYEVVFYKTLHVR
jgi:hypothetical protein